MNGMVKDELRTLIDAATVLEGKMPSAGRRRVDPRRLAMKLRRIERKYSRPAVSREAREGAMAGGGYPPTLRPGRVADPPKTE